ncbi:MAG: pantetheine-phosphate adenylyltransferase [Candidatus Riflebacteria bacterium]|nr:pantetheine-phosphate adenylyltransferase [Candidatus Riflebacteria bacterium]
MRVAVYPGSFDPFTKGHADILKRAAKLFDHVIVGVLVNPYKKCLFSPKERVQQICDVAKHLENVRVIHFDGLLVDFCATVGATAIIRGLRAVSDYEYEMQMFTVNNTLSPKIETVFLMASPPYSFLSSSIVKEVAKYGGDISNMVAPSIKEEVESKFEALKNEK